MKNGEKKTLMVGSTGCLVTTGQLNNGGYGPHRHRWIREYGPIPAGMDLDHLCRNRWCVNPDHLELVTRRENLARGKQSSRRDESLCRKGLHPWIEENIYIDGRGKNLCKQCYEIYHTNYRAAARKEL